MFRLSKLVPQNFYQRPKSAEVGKDGYIESFQLPDFMRLAEPEDP